MTKERAEEIRKAIMASHGWLKVGEQLSAEEDEEVMKFWNTLSGTHSYYDVVVRMTKGEHL